MNPTLKTLAIGTLAFSLQPLAFPQGTPISQLPIITNLAPADLLIVQTNAAAGASSEHTRTIALTNLLGSLTNLPGWPPGGPPNALTNTQAGVTLSGSFAGQFAAPVLTNPAAFDPAGAALNATNPLALAAFIGQTNISLAGITNLGTLKIQWNQVLNQPAIPVLPNLNVYQWGGSALSNLSLGYYQPATNGGPIAWPQLPAPVLTNAGAFQPANPTLTALATNNGAGLSNLTGLAASTTNWIAAAATNAAAALSWTNQPPLAALAINNAAALTNFPTTVVHDASAYGFSPASSAIANSVAISNAMAGACIVTISQPGVYLMCTNIFLPSGITLRGVQGGVVWRKDATYGAFIANAGTQNSTTNSNITLDGITFDTGTIIGTITNDSSANWPCEYSYLEFQFVNNLTVRNCTITNMFGNATAALNAIHIQGCQNFNIDNFNTYCSSVAGNDCVHINGQTSDGTIQNCYLETGDNAFAFYATDYPIQQRVVGDISHIKIRNVTVLLKGISNPYMDMFRFGPGAWTNWVSGYSYKIGDITCVNGVLYMNGNSGNPQVSTVAPSVSQSGYSQTTADGLTWYWAGSGSNLTANVRDIDIDGVDVLTPHRLLSVFDQNAPWYRATYSNSAPMVSCYHNAIVDGVRFHNVRLLGITNGAAAYAYGYIQNHVGDLTVDGLSFPPTNLCSGYLGLEIATNGWVEDLTLSRLKYPALPYYGTYPYPILLCDTGSVVQSATLIGPRIDSVGGIASADKFTVQTGSNSLNRLLVIGGHWTNSASLIWPSCQYTTSRVEVVDGYWDKPTSVLYNTTPNCQFDLDFHHCYWGAPSTAGALFRNTQPSTLVRVRAYDCDYESPNQLGVCGPNVSLIAWDAVGPGGNMGALALSLYQQTVGIPTNLVPVSTASATNWMMFANTNGCLYAVATNYAAGGWFMKQVAP